GLDMPQRSVFVHPQTVTDLSYLRTSIFPEPQAAQSITTTTEYVYDDAGNATHVTVTMEGIGEKYKKTSQNDYDPSIKGKRLGKMIRSTVTTQRLAPDVALALTHVTEFDYETLEPTLALALVRKRIEPGAGEGIELHTAYAYDNFGDVTVTTDCASDLD